MTVEREVFETYAEIDDDRLQQLAQVHRRRVAEAEEEVSRRRSLLQPFEDELARRGLA
ncbi:hypothetical protein [Fimbriimonas ginsengisoli]|uniref:Uncharacterized protein n=1 Tax=Fimbriimonas ginsengisoli Gsoil 348 TaxID=661478 RepID=A0A068NIT5_FIMGI|nr:hypothetical protein [Fimbriimonas ginsengisoli]AIE83503.1 hypothetical protein OP10G_0135 [Fimbriimonas ginsengisoli Gsoil 348]